MLTGMVQVLHIYDANEPNIAQHVAMLLAQPMPGFECMEEWPGADSVPGIVHVHGCWNRTIVRRAERLRQQGVRLVHTPHGALEPWVIDERRLTEKAAKTLLWQRRQVGNAYAVIAQGLMECDCLRQLKWNPRVETIRNAVVTSTITPEEMARQTCAVYQKVMDSYTLPLLSADAERLLAVLIKVGITGDRRWVEEWPTIGPTDWRRLLLLADHENIRQVIDLGISTLGISIPAIDTTQISAYFPTSYTKPTIGSTDPVSIAQQALKGPLCLLHLVELARALRQPGVDDTSLIDELADQSLTRYFQHLLQLVAEQTLLEEGFMPFLPVDDRFTRQMRRQLRERLKIED